MKTRKEWKHSCPIFLVHVKDRHIYWCFFYSSN